MSIVERRRMSNLTIEVTFKCSCIHFSCGQQGFMRRKCRQGQGDFPTVFGEIVWRSRSLFGFVMSRVEYASFVVTQLKVVSAGRHGGQGSCFCCEGAEGVLAGAGPGQRVGADDCHSSRQGLGQAEWQLQAQAGRFEQGFFARPDSEIGLGFFFTGDVVQKRLVRRHELGRDFIHVGERADGLQVDADFEATRDRDQNLAVRVAHVESQSLRVAPVGNVRFPRRRFLQHNPPWCQAEAVAEDDSQQSPHSDEFRAGEFVSDPVSVPQFVRQEQGLAQSGQVARGNWPLRPGIFARLTGVPDRNRSREGHGGKLNGVTGRTGFDRNGSPSSQHGESLALPLVRQIPGERVDVRVGADAQVSAADEVRFRRIQVREAAGLFDFASRVSSDSPICPTRIVLSKLRSRGRFWSLGL